jgi:2Fe-2S ferredoxin
MADITFFVEEANGDKTPITVPTDMGLSLMEVLKGSDYPILATCGGMALCATCHISLIEGTANEPTDIELDMLDTLFNATEQSRLSCQIRISELSDGAIVRVLGESQ